VGRNEEGKNRTEGPEDEAGRRGEKKEKEMINKEGSEEGWGWRGKI